MFPGVGDVPTTVWTAIRPHNWRPNSTQEYLVEFDMATGEAAVSSKRVQYELCHTEHV